MSEFICMLSWSVVALLMPFRMRVALIIEHDPHSHIIEQNKKSNASDSDKNDSVVRLPVETYCSKDSTETMDSMESMLSMAPWILGNLGFNRIHGRNLRGIKTTQWKRIGSRSESNIMGVFRRATFDLKTVEGSSSFVSFMLFS